MQKRKCLGWSFCLLNLTLFMCIQNTLAMDEGVREIPREAFHTEPRSQEIPQGFTFAPSLHLGSGQPGGVTFTQQIDLMNHQAQLQRENAEFVKNLNKKSMFERITGGTVAAVMDVVAVISALAPVFAKYFELQAVEAATQKKNLLEEKAFEQQSDMISIKLESEAIEKYLEKLQYIDKNDPEFKVLQRKYVELVSAHGAHIFQIMSRKDAQENSLLQGQLVPVEA